MALFKKESCCLCGGKTGLLDKKCLSGKVCKDCTKKLSVWFDDYKNTDKTQLEAQIKMREEYVKIAKMHDFNKVFGISKAQGTDDGDGVGYDVAHDRLFSLRLFYEVVFVRDVSDGELNDLRLVAAEKNTAVGDETFVSFVDENCFQVLTGIKGLILDGRYRFSDGDFFDGIIATKGVFAYGSDRSRLIFFPFDPFFF